MNTNNSLSIKRAVVLFVITFLLLPSKGMAQFSSKGLEQYNFHSLNPSYIISDSRLQIDVMPYNNTRYENKGMQSKIIFNIPKMNSGFGIGFNSEDLLQIDISSFHIDYAYKHSFTENLSLTGGVRLNYSKLAFRQANFIDFNTINKTLFSTALGTTFRYGNLHAGASVGIPIINRKKYYISDSETESSKDFDKQSSYQFICGYSFGKQKKFLFDPLISIQNSFDNTIWYFGANTLIKNFMGFGFTAGDLTSFSTSLNFKNRVSMILGIYSKDQLEYTIDFSEMNIIGQIRIKL